MEPPWISHHCPGHQQTPQLAFRAAAAMLLHAVLQGFAEGILEVADEVSIDGDIIYT